jgi:hypothetical protein
MSVAVSSTRWRAAGPFASNNSSKTGIIDEIGVYLSSLERTGDPAATRAELLDGGLGQKSRSGRETIVRIIQDRLVRWSPPWWVLEDLVEYARDYDRTKLRAGLLLHTIRQDTLLNDFVHLVIVPRWKDGNHFISRSDMQAFLDKAEPQHPEISRWSVQTREKLAGNALSILRDYGLLEGEQRKHIVEPTVPHEVSAHLVRLLQEEGIPTEEIPYHPDWQIWLMDSARVKAEIAALQLAGKIGKP